LKAKSSALSDVGRVRVSNEDFYSADDDQGFFIIADGMGGHAAGEVASKLAVEIVGEAIRAMLDRGGQAFQSSGELKTSFDSFLQEANDQILKKGYDNLGLLGMGTTLTFFLLRDGRYYIGHIGDSRAYRIRDNQIAQITEDHSYVGELVRQGIITKDEARVHPHKNIITRSLGTKSEAEMAFYEGEANPGDMYLLCTDGLTTEVEDSKIVEIITNSGSDPDSAVRNLIAAANEAGGRDNTTVVLVCVQQ